MIKTPMKILIPELCRMKMKIIMMILKTTRQKSRVIIYQRKKVHEEQLHEDTDSVDNNKESKDFNDGERMSL